MKTVQKLWHQGGMFIVFLVLFAVVSFTVPSFLGVDNLKSLALQVTTIGIVACSMMLCLASGDFDLSVGSTVAIAGVIAALLMQEGKGLVMACVCALAAGAFIGAANGFFIAKVGINALITTLASMQIVRGAALIIADGRAIGVMDPSYIKIGTASPLGVGVPIWVMVLCFGIFGFLLNKTVFGRNALAIGGNAEAANLAGIPVARSKILIFMIQGIMAALAGLVLSARLAIGAPKNGEGLELEVISACVLGGVSLTGGVATISGVVMGVFIMGIVQNAMNLLSIDSFWQKVATGAILLIAVMLDRLKHRGQN